MYLYNIYTHIYISVCMLIYTLHIDIPIWNSPVYICILYTHTHIYAHISTALYTWYTFIYICLNLYTIYTPVYICFNLPLYTLLPTYLNTHTHVCTSAHAEMWLPLLAWLLALPLLYLQMWLSLLVWALHWPVLLLPLSCRCLGTGCTSLCLGLLVSIVFFSLAKTELCKH